MIFCSTKDDQFSVSLQPAVGELLLPVTMTEQDFHKEQGEITFIHTHKTLIHHTAKAGICFSIVLMLRLLAKVESAHNRPFLTGTLP